eukprot:jgi/Bigna1/135768/aug1.31_g10476
MPSLLWRLVGALATIVAITPDEGKDAFKIRARKIRSQRVRARDRNPSATPPEFHLEDRRPIDIHVNPNPLPKVKSPKGDNRKRFETLQQAKTFIIDLAMDAAATSRVRTVHIHPGTYEPLALDHAALSGVEWRGTSQDTQNFPVISGGVRVPVSRFQPWPGKPAVMVASLQGLHATDLGSMQVNYNCVDGCQNDKVGLVLDGEPMTLARWPNKKSRESDDDNDDDDDDGDIDTWVWQHADAMLNDTDVGFAMNVSKTPDAARIREWKTEKDPYIHGYFSWDWADCYAKITSIDDEANGDDMIRLKYDGGATIKPWARWIGVNLLAELDAEGEFYIDSAAQKLYFYPPGKKLSSSSVVELMYQRGGVVNVTEAVKHATLSRLEIRSGRQVGLSASGVSNLSVSQIVVHAVGTHGIDMTQAKASTIRDSMVYDTGCSGIRATGGNASKLEKGGLIVEGNTAHHVALWKRTYMPGIYWGGVSNIYRNNTVVYSPHNCFLGGGDFEDGVDNLFEDNLLSDCTFETIDSGGFYTNGLFATAFTNRGNVLRGNTFQRIQNTAGTGVQVASNQAVYLDDEISAWLVTNNTFIDCQVGAFIGGGRENCVTHNRFVRCGTVQHLDNIGMLVQKDFNNCSQVAPPFQTNCNPGAAEWMVTRSIAAGKWAEAFPTMVNLSRNHPGMPAYNKISSNSYCNCSEFMNPLPDGAPQTWLTDVSDNVEDTSCY